MPLEPGREPSAARGFLEAFLCGAILLALLGGGVAAARLCADFVQLLAHVEVVMPG